MELLPAQIRQYAVFTPLDLAVGADVMLESEGNALPVEKEKRSMASLPMALAAGPRRRCGPSVAARSRQVEDGGVLALIVDREIGTSLTAMREGR